MTVLHATDYLNLFITCDWRAPSRCHEMGRVFFNGTVLSQTLWNRWEHHFQDNETSLRGTGHLNQHSAAVYGRNH